MGSPDSSTGDEGGGGFHTPSHKIYSFFFGTTVRKERDRLPVTIYCARRKKCFHAKIITRLHASQVDTDSR